MSVRALLQAAVVARLHASPALAGLAIFDAVPARAALPYLLIDEPVLVDWSTKSWTGREARLSVLLHDGGERPVRLRSLAAAAEEALLSLGGGIGEGWTIANATPVRSRLVRGTERWTASIDVQLRLYRQPIT